jgi:hypothetical protein
MRRLYFQSYFTGSELYGVFSWKFRRKFGAQPSYVLDLIGKVKNVDILICNPYPQAMRFHNVWQQGERCHPGMISVAKRLFAAASLDTSMIDARTGRATECYCNYWLANKRFMDLYFSYCERIYSAIYSDDNLKCLMLQGVRHEAINAPWFPFVFERLFSTILSGFESSFNVLVLDPIDSETSK